MVQAAQRTNPFPGLRSFEFGEDYLFFGREGQADELVRRLQKHRFVAVVGPSGSGKSSLVRSGLLPAIHSGFLQASGSYWLKVVVRPGGNPIRNLALGLNQPSVLGSDCLGEDAELQGLLVESTLRQGRLGLVEAVRLARLDPHQNLLVVVDQFEELFRFRKIGPGRGDVGQGEADEAAAFVKLLLAAVQQQEQPIYVVLTMRSDFLGDCARFVGLPETINDSQYLIPRMTRDQRRLAIEGPIGVVGGTISPRLVQRLLNDVGDDPDQLPILQHALMRTWDFWQGNHDANEPLDVHHYEAVGSMAAALSNHADDIFEQLTLQQQDIAKRLFQRLTERGQDGREIRRPTSLSEIARVADVFEDDVREVVDRFRGDNNSFLMPPPPEQLSSTTVLDISHESLMRIWGRLQAWVVQEAESAQEFLRLRDRASRYPDRAGLLQDPALTFALNWRRDEKPTAAWADRYAQGFEDAISFLDASVEGRSRELAEQERQTAETERIRRLRFQQVVGVAVAMAVLAGGALCAAIYGLQQKRHATLERDRARREVLNADLLAQSLKTDNLLDSDLDLEAVTAAIGMGRRIEALEQDGLGHQLYRSTRVRSEASLSEVVYSSRERNRLESHRGWVRGVGFSPDGGLLASASDDGTVKLWTVEGEELQTLEGHRGPVWSVSFSPDGKILASASDDGRVKLWNLEGEELQTLEGHRDWVRSVSFSPNGELLASASDDGTVKLWNLEGEELQTLEGHRDWVRSVSFSPSGELLASASADGTVKLWNLEGEELQTLEGHRRSVWNVSFSPNGELLASASSDGTVKLWTVEGEELRTLEGHHGRVLSVSFSSDGETLASASEDGTLKLWSVEGEELQTLEGHRGSVWGVSFNPTGDSPDGDLLVSASADGTVKLWAVEGEGLQTLEGHRGRVLSVNFSPIGDSPDGEILASASQDGAVKLWSLEGEELQTLEGHRGRVLNVSFSPDGDILASASDDRTVKLWTVEGEELQTLEGHRGRVWSVSFSPTGETLASASADGTVKVWNLEGEELQTLEGHRRRVWSVSFSPTGETLASASEDGTVKLWTVGGEELQTLEGHRGRVFSVNFNPTGEILASASDDGTVKLWTVEGEELKTLEGHRGRVLGVNFSPDGEILASASEDGTVRLWTVGGEELQTLEGHRGRVFSVNFSPTGEILASASEDSTVILWNFKLEDLLTRGCRQIANYLRYDPNVRDSDRQLCDGLE